MLLPPRDFQRAMIQHRCCIEELLPAKSGGNSRLRLSRKRNHVINTQANPDLAADGMVVVTGHQGQHVRAAGQAQRVEKFRTAKCFRNDFRLAWAVIVMDDVVGPQ